VEAVLTKLGRLGIQISRQGEDLRFRAPKGSLTSELRQEIARFKSEILAALAGSACSSTSEPLPGLGNPTRDERGGPLAGAAADQSTSSRGDGKAQETTPKSPSQNSQNSQNELREIPEDDFANSANIASGFETARALPRSTAVSCTSEASGEVAIGDSVIKFSRWSGQILSGEVIAFDTETAAIKGNEVPPLALASASDGTEHVLIHPDNIARFLLAHQDRHWVAHNITFDFAVVEAHLRQRGELDAGESLWRIVEENRAHDTLILDALYRLAMYDSYPRPRDLGTLAREYAGLEIDKADPYRLRYGEIIDRPWNAVDPGFFEYAIKDAVATWRVDAALRQKAEKCARRHCVPEETIRRWGVLTESLQIRGALALAQVTRNGLQLDLEQSERVYKGLQARLQALVERLSRHARGRDLFKIDRKIGKVKFTKSHAPSFSTKVVREILLDAVKEIESDSGVRISTPLTEKKAISTSGKEWAEYAKLHPFLADWVKMTEVATLIGFFQQLRTPVVYPNYSVLVRTGRTSCSGPNIQQIPRQGGFREIFTASPGHFLLAADFAFIELRTLAAVCEARFGSSVLADVIRADRDPHAYSAALLLGLEPDEFLSLQATEPGKFKSQRQAAKALNFGIPGGLGPASLVCYARRSYGVEMSLEEAQEFRDRMIHEVYPEWALYLDENPMANLAQSLGTTAEECWQVLDWSGKRSPALAWAVRRIVRGKTLRKNGQPYNPRFVDGVWNGLRALNRSRILAPFLSTRQGSLTRLRLRPTSHVEWISA
jgi:DNA polymerase I-like protein with 3'-5' exonuclease and polymerase domains